VKLLASLERYPETLSASDEITARQGGKSWVVKSAKSVAWALAMLAHVLGRQERSDDDCALRFADRCMQFCSDRGNRDVQHERVNHEHELCGTRMQSTHHRRWLWPAAAIAIAEGISGALP